MTLLTAVFAAVISTAICFFTVSVVIMASAAASEPLRLRAAARAEAPC